MDGRTRWLDPHEVKQHLRPMEIDDEEDSSTSSSGDDDRGTKATQFLDNLHESLNVSIRSNSSGFEDSITPGGSSDEDKRLRANSTYVREADDAEDVYTQLRDEWTVGR
eukprot:UN00236